jgi:hypothetical protein
MVDLTSSPEDSSVDSAPQHPLRRFLHKAGRNWLERHRHPFNFAIHMFGIPIALAGLVFMFIWPWWGLAGLFVGYLLQYIGHAVEGNDVGEWAAIKRMFGLPYVGIAPQWQDQTADANANVGK